MTFGLWSREWMHVQYPPYPAVGNIEAEFFEPASWKPQYPNPAFNRMDAADAFWAASLVSQFTDEIIRAIVAAGMKRDLSKNAPAEFPDSVTTRGAKHLVELANMVGLGHRAVMFYLVQRQDAKSFAIAADIDPVYAEGLAAARKAGVEVLCYGCKLSKSEIRVEGPLPLAF